MHRFALNQPFARSTLLRQPSLSGIRPATAVRLLQDMPRRGNPLFAESAPPIPAIRPSQKQKIELICNFFAIADSSPPLESE